MMQTDGVYLSYLRCYEFLVALNCQCSLLDRVPREMVFRAGFPDKSVVKASTPSSLMLLPTHNGSGDHGLLDSTPCPRRKKKHIYNAKAINNERSLPSHMAVTITIVMSVSNSIGK